MAQLKVNDLSFSYESSFDPIFEHVSFTLDTSWKLGFIGRNGKGKTTFLNLLLGKYEYSGSISCDVRCDYFPYRIDAEDLGRTADELMEQWKPGVENWRVMCEIADLSVDAELLYRPLRTLSFGEKTKVMLAVLFAGENDFLLIDEPTNHLDQEARELVKSYLAKKKGFILVSHDRDLLDACVDHVLVIQKTSIDVQSGNFSSWWDNKERADAFARAENEKHLKEIGRLKGAMQQSQGWATKGENTKIGYDPIKEHDRTKNARTYISSKTKKMEARVKVFEQRMGKQIAEKEGLLNDVEQIRDLRLSPMTHYKDRLVETRNLSFQYKDAERPVFTGLTFEIRNGERVFLQGKNGCGKTSLIKAILRDAGYRSGETETGESREDEEQIFSIGGTLLTAPHLKISYINQDTSHLHGDLRTHAFENGVDYSLFLAVLRQLALEQVQFEKNIEDFSEGQKKKVLIATSLLTPAHLYIWDEPLNYVDVFSRIQLEKLITEYQPTMLIVEHDVRFREKMATKVVEL
ncbi:MAG: ABC-F family ATP-binding cassette domain-containing protein [Clostridiales bacterium]|nr:ABC-F family ATP-binding cassette domain-containing protein [Clostridiales bacterium]